MTVGTTALEPTTAIPAIGGYTASSNPNQALWEKGDFTRIAETMRIAGEKFVATLGIEPGVRVLDVGSGDGTTAIPAAQLGAEVLAIDIARNLVDAGNRRAQQRGLANVRFQQGDASQLVDIADDSVDLVVTVFGAMFAPRPNDVAKELVRVTSRGGRIVMGNWIPGDPTLVAQILRISSSYSPPPPEGFVSPMLWGKEEEVIARFGAAGISASQIAFERERWTFTLDAPPSSLLRIFRDFYGPTMNAFDAAAKSGREQALWDELEALFASQNVSGDANTTVIPATFLRVTVTRE